MIKSILVIDDDESVRKSFMLSLEDTNYKVDTAESGMSGIELYKLNRYNLIFLDLKMSGLNGVQTLCQLREIDNDVPIYIITAFHEEFIEELRKASDLGINFEILKKPISSDQIRLVTDSILDIPTAVIEGGDYNHV
jgi:two-component system, response regulator, stage 0 sporulation protein F